MFIFIAFIYVGMQNVSKFNKLQDLYTIYRSMSCAIFSVLVTVLKVLGILFNNKCTIFSTMSTVHRHVY